MGHEAPLRLVRDAPLPQCSTGRQFEPWVGNQWEPGETGGSPYYIGDAINDSVDDAAELMIDRINKLAAKAFPD